MSLVQLRGQDRKQRKEEKAWKLGTEWLGRKDGLPAAGETDLEHSCL